MAICISIMCAILPRLSNNLTFYQAIKSIISYDETKIATLVLHTNVYPRIIVALMSGAILAITGCITQNIFKNNLLSPSTLGISSGIYFAISTLSITGFVSSFLLKSIIGTISGLLTIVLVFIMAGGAKNPLKIILSGITISIFLSSFSMVIIRIFNGWNIGIFAWAGGDMLQKNWKGAKFICLYGVPFLFLIPFFIKKIEIIALGESTAHNLGLNTKITKIFLLTIITCLVSTVLTVVGLISYIGFIVPNILYFFKITKIKSQIFLSMLLGSTLLLVTDTLVFYLNKNFKFNLFTGNFTVFLGSILLFALIVFGKKYKGSQYNNKMNLCISDIPIHKKNYNFLFMLLIIMLSTLFSSFFFGLIHFKIKDFYNFFIIFDKNIILDLRLARFLTAIFVGFLLGLSGSLIQSIIRNPVSSPEILGTSSLASLFMVIGIMSTFKYGSILSRANFIVISSMGALFGLCLLLFFAKKRNFETNCIPLIGMSLSAISSGIMGFIINLNIHHDMRESIFSWFSGSLYGLLIEHLKWFLLLAPILIIPIFIFNYYRDSFDLGELIMHSLGMPIKFVKTFVLIFISFVIGYTTTLVGPISFIGLVAPHIARINGSLRGKNHLLMSGLSGAMFLSFGDYLGQKIAFPYELPASFVVSSLILPYFVYMMYKSKNSVST